MIYIYICKNCFNSFEKLYLNLQDGQIKCPECGSEKVETHESKTLSSHIKDYFLTERSL